MYAQVEKPKENKSRAIVNSVVQNKNNIKQNFGFTDNRPESVAQRKLKADIIQFGGKKKNKKFKNKGKEFIGGKDNNTHVHEYPNGGGHLKVNGVNYNLEDQQELAQGIEALEQLGKGKKKKNTKKNQQFFDIYPYILEAAKKWQDRDPDPDGGGRSAIMV